MHTSNPTLATVAVALLSALPTVSAGIYTKSSPVLQVDAKSYDRLVAKSNYTTVLEFYAPWCGHCQNLKPAYEKAAKNLDGLAQVAAINCDEDENKSFCGQFGVQGFPTLKIARPGKKSGKPVVEDYNGPRSAKGIVDAVVDKINNHVKKVTDKDLDSFLSTKNDTAKAILFTEKGTTSALLKSLAIDFLDVIQVAQVRNKEAKANELFGVTSYPALVLLPGGDKPGLLYDGEMKKDAMVKFLSQAGAPNPVSGPAKSKAKKEKKEKASPKSSDAKSKSKEAAEEETTTAETPKATKAAEVAPAIPAITEPSKLIKECLNPKSGTCILAVVPSAHGATAEKALGSLSELAHKHAEAKRHLFPFYEIHTADANVAALVKSLEITKEVELIAVNGKRKWWRQYEGDFSGESIESWIDAIRLSEGTKKKLPAGVLSEVAEEAPKAEKVEVKVEEEVKVEVPTESESTSWQGAEPTPEATAAEHDEL
ncbi:thioredoxin-domain-containing protein [Apiospora arundinis]|uniref:protein disulfide-isomerase n=1 Tax=Apiospora arundinis TaxID=335852 RepID=A0ABR2I4S7_9PEZI